RSSDLTNQNGQPYQVFGAFKKACYSRLEIALPKCYTEITAQNPITLPALDQFQQTVPDIRQLCDIPVPESIQQLWPACENHAHTLLEQFLENHIQHYHIERDFPAHSGTSQLSAYLNIGVLSIRQCIQALFRHQSGYFVPEQEGQSIWLDELLWREFYQHILYLFPNVSKYLPFKANARNIPWQDDKTALTAWQQGQTGIPIVDAGMRQLLVTGWMHNRVRMITAMFLCKNLLIDWRQGEQWFMQHLIDGDLAANNGGWQWCASTGTDSVPYFRIFNPVSQSRKFDPEGQYIRTWIPELAHLDAKTIHAPYESKTVQQLDYPKPIVDLKYSRARAIDHFKQYL
ncbi:MAG TPA: deoxyribodipyrimidine photo-lyase, partial [Acinetobacter radioresistens]|nr:deoxyribodipyrimidine photo-lyase [Acinetobacter radioresistens]